jgi:hypothetical protein
MPGAILKFTEAFADYEIMISFTPLLKIVGHMVVLAKVFSKFFFANTRKSRFKKIFYEYQLFSRARLLMKSSNGLKIVVGKELLLIRAIVEDNTSIVGTTLK